MELNRVPQPRAILLHGPPCVGKTQLSLAIRDLAAPGSVRLLSLDEGWLPGDFRHSGGTRRYSDLQRAPEPVLVIELGCGEPLDLASPGATSGASEWVRVLRDSSRALYAFRLVAEPADVLNRLRHRHRGKSDALFQIWQQFGLYALFEARDPIATFPPDAAIDEAIVSTTGRSIGDVALEIMQRAGIGNSTA